MIGIIDYGMGNIKSVFNAFKYIGADIELVSLDVISKAEALVLPGVGAFRDTSAALEPYMDELKSYINNGRPFLGICIGLQYLFEESYENGRWKGLGLFDGPVKKLPMKKLPQIGWNSLEIWQESRLLAGITPGSYVYYINTYAAPPNEASATSTYGSEFAAVVENVNLFGTQFHPEKSGYVGLKILKNFVEVVKCPS